jgi:hypothetical protein
MSSSNTSDSQSQPKRVPCACAPCRKSKVRCDHARPCARCTLRGTQNQCIDQPVSETFPNLKKKINQISEANFKFDVEEDLVMMLESDDEDFSSVPTSLDELIEFNKPNFEFISERDFSLDSSFKDLKFNNNAFEFNFEFRQSMNISQQLILDDLALIE